MIQTDLNIILPEIILAIYAMLALVGAVYSGKDRLASLMVWATGALMLFLALWIGLGSSETRVAFHGMFIDDA